MATDTHCVVCGKELSGELYRDHHCTPEAEKRAERSYRRYDRERRKVRTYDDRLREGFGMRGDE